MRTWYTEELLELLEPYTAMWDGRLGKVVITQHRIDLVPGARPVFQPPRRAGPAQRDLEEVQVREMLDGDVAEPSTSEWAAPIVFAP